ncbi:hypothetical protein [Thermogladius sp.]|uniref:hypothetical protein n=1 Tax=Thermogladius sp. TaxID=2023064 RepID=UPI003D0F8699
MERRELARAVERYFQLSEDEAVDLADELDTLYNNMKAKYIELLWKRGEGGEGAAGILKRAVELLNKEELSQDEELILIALLDILSTDLYDRYLLYRVEPGEE